jgi:hypothetical protein
MEPACWALKNPWIISQRGSFRTAHKLFANDTATIFLTVEVMAIGPIGRPADSSNPGKSFKLH